MIVGIDFDNTIVCYDGLFYQAAVARNLIPSTTSPAKEAVRDTLRAAHREAEWTELQGLVYGHEIQEAQPFPGVSQFVQRCYEQQVTVHVISHRTRQPFAGPAIDLHQAARDWLVAQGWYSEGAYGLSAGRVYFEETKADKLARIATAGCDVFIDDLPELLGAPGFPGQVKRVLFDPHATSLDEQRFPRAGSWAELVELLLGDDL